jgi:hypothetical protein
MNPPPTRYHVCAYNAQGNPAPLPEHPALPWAAAYALLDKLERGQARAKSPQSFTVQPEHNGTGIPID